MRRGESFDGDLGDGPCVVRGGFRNEVGRLAR